MVKPFTVSMMQQVALHGQPRRQPARAQDGQRALGAAQRVRPHRDAADGDPHQVRVPQADPPLALGRLLQLLLPAGGIGVRYLDLTDELVEHQVEQAVLAADVPVQRRGPGPELLAEPPHAQRGQPLTVQ
jgi:hypothetical protein